MGKFTIPRKVRDYAKVLGQDLGPSYNQMGITKAQVRNEQGKLRDCYLEGWSDAMAIVEKWLPDDVFSRLQREVREAPYIGMIENANDMKLKVDGLKGPHDRPDCPCGHPPGTQGPCGGCNCADDPIVTPSDIEREIGRS